MKTVLLIVLATVLAVSVSCRNNQLVDGGSARIDMDGDRVSISLDQSKNPQRESIVRFRFADLPPTLRTNIMDKEIEIRLAGAAIPEPRIDHSTQKTIMVIAGIIFIALGGALLTPWTGGPHVRLAGVAAGSGILIISISFTIERFALFYVAGVAAVAGIVMWMLWSAYRQAQTEAGSSSSSEETSSTAPASASI